MDSNKELAVRITMIALDDQISVRHIGVYVALLHLWCRNQMTSPFQISRSKVMKLARVGSIVTYHKCINDLNTLGYIQYQPSFDPILGSTITLM